MRTSVWAKYILFAKPQKYMAYLRNHKKLIVAGAERTLRKGTEVTGTQGSQAIVRSLLIVLGTVWVSVPVWAADTDSGTPACWLQAFR